MRLLTTAFFVLFTSSVSFAQNQTQPQPQDEISQPAPTYRTQTSRGNTFNPDIGINALFLYQNSNRGEASATEERNGFSVQEAELQFSADVDPYWRFASTFSLHQEFDAGTGEREYVFEPEEIFAESLSLPAITARVGKFKAAFGKHNLLHTHAFPFIDAPLSNQALLGDEGLNDVGVSVAALMPLPWFSEVTAQGLSGQGEGVGYFAAPTSNSVVGLAKFKNLWDLSSDLTFEFGLSGATGKNSDSRATDIYGADTTFKWRPDGSKTKALIWTVEGIKRDLDRAGYNEKGRGLATWLQYQFGPRWWVQARAEYLDLKDQDPALIASGDALPDFARKQSALIGFIPSEFSALRLQYDHLNDGAEKDEDRVLLQFNYSIGAHPAHAY